jgi:hypothetical protein
LPHNTESELGDTRVYRWNKIFLSFTVTCVYSLSEIVFTEQRTAFSRENLILKCRSSSSQLKINVKVIIKTADSEKHASFPFSAYQHAFRIYFLSLAALLHSTYFRALHCKHILEAPFLFVSRFFVFDLGKRLL